MQSKQKLTQKYGKLRHLFNWCSWKCELAVQQLAEMVLPLCYAEASYEKHDPIELAPLNAHLPITERAKEWCEGLKLVGIMPGDGGLAPACTGWLWLS